MQPYLDKCWTLALHDTSKVFDFKWDEENGRWVIVQHKIGWSNDWLVMAVVNPDGSYRPIDSSTILDFQRNVWVATGEFRKWCRRELNKEGYRREKREANEYDDALQAGKEIAPLLRTIKDAGKNSIHGESTFMFPGHGESKIFGGVA